MPVVVLVVVLELSLPPQATIPSDAITATAAVVSGFRFILRFLSGISSSHTGDEHGPVGKFIAGLQIPA
jgi:hypothetical protein